MQQISKEIKIFLTLLDYKQNINFKRKREELTSNTLIKVFRISRNSQVGVFNQGWS